MFRLYTYEQHKNDTKTMILIKFSGLYGSQPLIIHNNTHHASICTLFMNCYPQFMHENSKIWEKPIHKIFFIFLRV